MFSGSCVALITPFKGNEIDEPALRQLVKRQVDGGTDVLVPVGTTGESATLSFAEHKRVIEIVVEENNGHCKVLAGAGANNTAEAIELTRFAKEVGCDGTLQVAPYYNKPTQQGLYEHYRAIAEAVDLPMIIYNIPGRCVVNISVETLKRLSELPQVVGVKEASGNLAQVNDVVMQCGESFCVLSGDDILTLPILSLGGRGVISVVANLVPEKVKAMITAWQSGDAAKALALHRELTPLIKACFYETNPIPVKTAAALMGLCEASLRLPMTPMQEENKQRLIAVLQSYGLL